MQQTLITQQDSTDINGTNSERGTVTTFQQCLKASQGLGIYHKKLFLIMAAHWIFASFFMSLPFFLFKKPIYCQSLEGDSMCCQQGDQSCVNYICSQFINQIIKHVKPEESLTYLFQLFCDKEWIRIIYKIFPYTLSFIGFLLYGAVSDVKGRKVALKIAWRMYTVGIVMFSVAQSEFLKSIGYAIASIHCFPSLIIQFVLFFQHNSKKQKNSQSLIIMACLSVGPLVLSAISALDLIQKVDNRLLLGLSCAIPASILCLLDSMIYESAVCMYRFNKALAFGILNSIAKQNKKLPILIDLSKSYWFKSVYPSISLISLLKHNKINKKMILGFCFLFTTTFTIRVSQISLDFYVATQYRSMLVNIPDAVADLTLCIFLLKVKDRTCRHLNILIVLLIISLLALRQQLFEDKSLMKIITIVHAVLIRYLSQLCNGLLMIWSIQNFPTICRNYCVGFVFCGSALGILLAYILRKQTQAAYIISLVCTTIAIVSQGSLQLHKFGIMKDTLNEQYYDQNDSFYKS